MGSVGCGGRGRDRRRGQEGADEWDRMRQTGGRWQKGDKRRGAGRRGGLERDTGSLISPRQDKDIMSSMQIFHNVL